MKDEMGEGGGTQLFAASTGDGKRTEYYGCLRMFTELRFPIAPVRVFQPRCALRNIPFTPYLSVPIRRGRQLCPVEMRVPRCTPNGCLQLNYRSHQLATA